MSRVAKAPIPVPSTVTVNIKQDDSNELVVEVKGSKGSITLSLSPLVKIVLSDGVVTVSPKDDAAVQGSVGWAQAGTARALIANAVHGVEKTFERKLQLVGVGYRAQAKGKTLQLNVGFSHPVEMEVPEGLTAQTPSQTEIVITGIDKQVLCQFAANVRSTRPPEPYKGKGIRYSDEHVRTKEAKKK